MMGTVRWLPRDKDVVEAVASILQDEGDDMSGVAVVFQGKRPAHFLRRSLAAVRGRAFLPPRIFSIDDLVDHCYRQLPDRAEADLAALDASAILYDIHKAMGSLLGGGAFTGLDAFLPIAERLFSALEELRMANVDPRLVKAAFDPVALAEGPLLAHFYREFYDRVGKERLSTRAVRYTAVAEAIESLGMCGFRRLILAGFVAFTGAETRLIAGLLTHEETLFLIKEGPGIRERMATLHLPGPPEQKSAPSEPRIAFYRCGDTHGEVFGLARKVKELLDTGAPLDERTVIVLPAPDALFPVVHWALALLEEESYNISMGYPVTRTPVYGFLAALFQVVTSMDRGKLYAPDYMKFVLHPYVKNIRFKGRSDATRILFHAMEEWLAGDQSRTYLTLEELESDGEFITHAVASLTGAEMDVTTDDVRDHLAEIHRQTIGRMLSPVNIGVCARSLMEVLLYIGEQSTAYEHALFRPFVLTLLEQLDAVTVSRLANVVLDSPEHYVRVLSSCLQGARVPFPGTPLHGVQVLGFLETRNLHFDRVIMLDMNDDVMPGTPEPDPFLPPAVRLALRLPGHHEWEEVAAYDVEALLSGAQEVHLFFKEGGQHEKSRFVEHLLWEQQLRDGVTETEQYIRNVHYAVNLAHREPAAIAKSEAMLSSLRSMHFSATALDTYLRCPLRFHHRYLLQLAEKQEVEGGVDSAGLGKFVHRVLAEFDRVNVNQRLRPDDCTADALVALVDRLFSEDFGVGAAGARYLMREQVKKHLADVLTSYRRPLLMKHEVELIGVEVKLQASWNGITLKGYADRIERRGDRVYILDYKTGANNGRAVRFETLDPHDRGTWEESIASLQLPLYALLYAKSSNVPFDRIVPAYVMLGRAHADESIEIPLYEAQDDVHRCRVVLEEVIGSVVKEMRDPAQPFSPTRDPGRQCPSCSFAGLCGMQWAGR